MNVRKNIDYSDMYAVLDRIMAAQMSQMELYCEVGKAVCQRSEKGAAVAAAEYLSNSYPNAQGFSPRNIRRMRDFYRTYEDNSFLLATALQVGWTQNVVIMEANLPIELREWYLRATNQFNWSKAELTEKIAGKAHEVIFLSIDGKEIYSDLKERAIIGDGIIAFLSKILKMQRIYSINRYQLILNTSRIISYPTFWEKWVICMIC